MGKRGACDGLISKAQKDKMAARCQKALDLTQKMLGRKRGAKTRWPPGCKAGTFPRPYWLPRGWRHGVKEGTRGYSGRGLPVYISPDETKYFYHKPDIEKYLGRVLTAADGEPPSVEEILSNATLRSAAVRHSPRTEASLFALLNEKERAALPSADAFMFCVISARRTSTTQGIRDCLRVQAHFEAAGVRPRWYVDPPSLEGYKGLGLDARKDGGSLCSARNMALKDAERAGKACCQISDDLVSWSYFVAPKVEGKSDAALNAAAKKARCLRLSPVAAARFLVAKLRASGSGAKLAGVLPTGNIARALGQPEVTTKSFVLGDFHVVDKGSQLRFDERFRLKEDYDFSCLHIKKYGGVVRCNRMIVNAKHRVNAGGCCTVRNSELEQKSIKLLRQKWPRAIRLHPTRADEVVLAWPKSR